MRSLPRRSELIAAVLLWMFVFLAISNSGRKNSTFWRMVLCDVTSGVLVVFSRWLVPGVWSNKYVSFFSWGLPESRGELVTLNNRCGAPLTVCLRGRPTPAQQLNSRGDQTLPREIFAHHSRLCSHVFDWRMRMWHVCSWQSVGRDLSSVSPCRASPALSWSRAAEVSQQPSSPHPAPLDQH